MIFLHHKRKRGYCRIRLCGTCKEHGSGSVYLHELHGISRQTVPYEGRNAGQADLLGEESLEPVKTIPPDDGPDAALIKRRVIFTDSVLVRTVFKSADDRMLVGKGDPVVRDDGS